MRSITRMGVGVIAAVAMGGGAAPALASNDPSPGGANPIPACGQGNGPNGVPTTAQGAYGVNGVGNVWNRAGAGAYYESMGLDSIGAVVQYQKQNFIFPTCGSNVAPPSQTPPLPGGTN